MFFSLAFDLELYSVYLDKFVTDPIGKKLQGWDLVRTTYLICLSVRLILIGFRLRRVTLWLVLMMVNRLRNVFVVRRRFLMMVGRVMLVTMWCRVLVRVLRVAWLWDMFTLFGLWWMCRMMWL